MKFILDEKIYSLAERLSASLYVVGGYTRNFLIDGSYSSDIDLASSCSVEEVVSKAEEFGYNILATYKRTGTVVFGKGKFRYEYTRMRTENYAKGGEHNPSEVFFTNDVVLDAKRRDFKCNAVYYDLSEEKFVDPLGGINDIKNKILDTVVGAEKVFSNDGLRLLRLARFSAELSFKPTSKVLLAMQKYASNIDDISVERIYDELKKIFSSDEKYSFSDKNGHYTALKILADTGVLFRIIPELSSAKGMFQRKDYHNYDVLEHTLRCVMYAPKEIRLSALLHDVGKPYCMEKYGKFHSHDTEGVKIAEKILKRLKVDSKTTKETLFLIGVHMLDMKKDVREIKLKRFIVKNYEYIYKLLALKQADYSACKDDLSVCPTVARWTTLIEKMKADGTPFSLKDLKITANDLMELGYKGESIGKELKKLLDITIEKPSLNNRERLLIKASDDLSSN